MDGGPSSRHHPLSTPGFSWDTLGAMVGGQSAIDVPALRVRTYDQAKDYLRAYGYDPDDAVEQATLERHRVEAMDYIESELIADEGLTVPADLRHETDVCVLLLAASSELRDERQRWACAILRVMHTVSHAHSSFEERYGAQIREQILARFRPHVVEGPDGLALGTGPDAIPLSRFDVKSHKPLRSIITKLLHKVENVAADIFDQVGLRFVTRERFDALLVVRYLRTQNVVVFGNVKPSRSRNTLIDMEWLRREMEDLDDRVDHGGASDEDRLAALRAAVRSLPFPPPDLSNPNPHSSTFYRSIQFTARQQIHIPNPLAAQLRLAIAELPPSEEARELATELRAHLEQDGDQNIFFPFEVQVLDEEAWQLTRSGLAAHTVYKARQRETVKRRVLGGLLRTHSRG